MHLSTTLAILCILLVARLCSTKIVRFARDTCPYCVRSHSAWMKFRAYNMWNPFLSTIDIDTSTVRGKEIMRQYGIKSVPTIIKIEGLKLSKYEGDRSWQDLTTFAYA